MSKKIAIHWFRQDLRLTDNPALHEASNYEQVMPIYILDDINASDAQMGGASRMWLHHSLENLNTSLSNKLNLYIGDPEKIFQKLINQYDIVAITWTRCYEPWRINRDKKLKSFLKSKNIEVKSDNGSLLWEPWEIVKKDNTPYKVFTPYYQRGCLGALPPREPVSKPRNLNLIKDTKNSKQLSELKLLPEKKWHQTIEACWQIGEKSAQNKLKKFLDQAIQNYSDGRNLPAKPYTSRLSPHLHFGEISPNQVWYAAKEKIAANSNNLKVFLSELGWREFSYSLLYQFPKLPKRNWKDQFDKFPWIKSKSLLKKWQRGMTGYPIVDAGMRELWQTGYMHNRVRMIVGSFLVKNLMINWQEGEKWFWDCLVDADLASNSASWQWVAGSGADAAPYFRIFNPITQGQKFDKDGEYTKKYVPELKNMPIKYLFNPFDAPIEVLEQAGVKLGQTYPKPIVDIKLSRQKALEAYNSIKG